jgi:BirA family biotin operon repressor/biotin-[acetyl-CoA-carboxylase] ligase
LSGTLFAGRIHTFVSVESTNDEARRLASEGAPDGTVVIADRQTAGRGRHGRHWYSAPGLGLYLSVVFRLDDDPRTVTRWTLGAAVAACEACRDLSAEEVEIKWPNDLVHRGQKLGGILAELRGGGQGSAAELIIGSGINVGHTRGELPAELEGRTTSLHLLSCARMLEREDLAAAFLHRLDAVARDLRRCAWAAVARRFERLSPGCRGDRVKVRATDGGSAREVIGVTDGIAPDGALVVRGDAGRLVLVRMADSVIPVGS